MLSLVPVKKLSTQSTSCPSASSRSQRCEPRKPAPPVTRTRLRVSLPMFFLFSRAIRGSGVRSVDQLATAAERGLIVSSRAPRVGRAGRFAAHFLHQEGGAHLGFLVDPPQVLAE